MAPLDSNLFTGEAQICETDILNCEAKNLGTSIEDILTDFGWGGKAVGCVILHLSPDNGRVVKGTFQLKGTEETQYKFQANKFWANADSKVMVSIQLPALDGFSFTDGGLTSDFLPDEEVIHFFHANREGGGSSPILAGNLANWGIGRFCLRLVCHVAKSSGVKNGVKIKYTAMLFPATAASLHKMSHLSSMPGWPGFKLGEGECPVMPTPTVQWGCPILPILSLAVTFEVCDTVPSAALLQQALAGIMSQCGLPETARGAKSLAEKWDRLTKNPAEYATKPPPVCWPVTAAPPAETGK